MSIVPEPYVPPIWRPLARYRVWRARRRRARAIANFSSFLMPIVKNSMPRHVLNEIVNVQPIGGEPQPERSIEAQEERLRVAQEAAVQEIAERMSDEAVLQWSIVRIRWWRRLWRWAKGSKPEGCVTAEH